MTLYKYDIVNIFAKKIFDATHERANVLEISTLGTGHKNHKFDRRLMNIDIYLYQGNPNHSTLRNDIHYETINDESQLKLEYDIIFVDPEHSFERSKYDIELAYKLLKINGIMVIHDCSPKSYKMIPFNLREWCGDTYKAFINFKHSNPDISSYVVDEDYGCGVITKNNVMFNNSILPNLETLSAWSYFDLNRKELLTLISAEEFIENQA
jgi:hypothetical protein